MSPSPWKLTNSDLDLLLSLSDLDLERWLVQYSTAQQTSILDQLLMRSQLAPGGKTGTSMYAPHKPWPKQRLFLDLDCLEAFFGGAAGGGKSDTLLMAALEYAHLPNYAALILRRDFARLSLPGSIMDRAKAWLFPHEKDGVTWNEQRKMFRFPAGGSLQFGYIDSLDDRFRYASSEFQFIGWDELTEFPLPTAGQDGEQADGNPYLFMFSRLRKTRDNPIPLRVRSASNPGGEGHEFVKTRFIPPEAEADMRSGQPKDIYWRLSA